jgi:hypothetical protein
MAGPVNGSATRAGAPPAWGHLSHPATGLALPVPPGWQAARDTGAALVLAGPGQAARFRPNAVATVERPPPAVTEISAYTAASVAGLQRMLTGLHVIAIDVVTIGGQDGRRVLCGYRDGAYAIAAESWSAMTAGVATSLTASCQVEDYLDLSPVFENIAAGMVPAVRLPAPETVPEAAPEAGR